jgi:hypothetical protein
MPFRKHPAHKKVSRNPDSSGLLPSFLRKQESMFSGTRRRKNFRKEPDYLRRPSADQHGPRVKPGVTGEGETDPGVTGTEGLRIRPAPFRHSGLDPNPPRSALRPSSVIPAKAGIHVQRNETAEKFPERTGLSPAPFSRSIWTPGPSSRSRIKSGMTDTGPG